MIKPWSAKHTAPMGGGVLKMSSLIQKVCELSRQSPVPSESPNIQTALWVQPSDQELAVGSPEPTFYFELVNLVVSSPQGNRGSLWATDEAEVETAELYVMSSFVFLDHCSLSSPWSSQNLICKLINVIYEKYTRYCISHEQLENQHYHLIIIRQ